MRKIFSAALALVCIWFATPARAALPSGYTELQYIESTGRQYIDTGVGLNAANKITGKISFVTLNTLSYIAGGRLSSGAAVGYALYGASHSGFTIYNTTWPEQGVNISANQILEFETVMKSGQQSFIVNGDTIITSDRTISLDSNNIYLFGLKTEYMATAKIYYLKIYNNDTLVRNFVPAKDSSGVIGMYDTVNNRFYTNAGTGEFIAGDPVTDNSCRNLLNPNDPDYGNYTVNIDGTYNYANDRITTGFIPVTGGNTLTVSTNINVGDISGFQFVGIAEYNASKQYITRSYANAQPTLSVTLNSNTAYVQVFEQFTGLSNVTPALFATYQQQLEVGSTATAYVPYNASCHNQIKIATTKYNESAFGPLNTALANAISVVDTVVSNTITQAGRIATLQAQKQTRPNDIADDNEKCPAGKKCLLVEDASGIPHWYEIVESVLQSDYTQLEYVSLTGSQYIDTGLTSYKNTNVLKIKIRPSQVDSTVFITFQNPNTGQANIGLFISGGKLYYQYGASDRIYAPIVADTDYVIEAGNGYLTVNGTTYTGSTHTEFTINSTLYVGVASVTSGAVDSRGFRGNIYYYRYEDKDGNLLFKGTPAKNSSGVIGMYDTVSGQFFTNAGSGEFVAGDPVAE